MEVRNITPAQSSPVFGMAFIKPSKDVMEALEKSVYTKHLEAFVKEQSQAKYHDIIAEFVCLPRYCGSDDKILRFKIVPKEGVDTLGYEHKGTFRMDEAYPTYKERVIESYKKDLEKIQKGCNTKFKRFIFKRIMVPLCNISAKKEIKDIEKNHPERMILPQLREAGNVVWNLESSIDRAAKISKIFDA